MNLRGLSRRLERQKSRNVDYAKRTNDDKSFARVYDEGALKPKA